MSSQQQQQLSQHPSDSFQPPALPPKLGSSCSGGNAGGGILFRPSENVVSGSMFPATPGVQFSFLQQLVQSSQSPPELLDTLRRHQMEQPRRAVPKGVAPSPKSVTRSPHVVTRSPSCAASLYAGHHQRAVSMLEPVTSFSELASPATPSGRFVKHIRSSSTLAPMPETPASRRITQQQQHRSTGNVVQRVASSVTPSRHSKAAPLQRHLHKSTSNLTSHPESSTKPASHQRSSSTPYEGFVV
jgi:hypothetical protein